jgi:ribosomal protein L21E
MSKVIAKQIDNILKGDKFIRHKKNAKGNTAIYSRNHPTAKFVRVVVDSGIDLNSAKASKSVRVKLVYINRAKSWREITTEVITDAKGLASLIKKVEAAEKFVKTCKFCKAKKFKAKTGNTVCSNACWTAWAGKKKSGTKKKKTSQKKITASTVKKAARNPSRKPQKKSSQRKGQKNLQRFTQEILPGDLVTIEEFIGDEVTTDYTGTVLGIVQKVKGKFVVTVWTANTAQVPEWLLPTTNYYEANALKSYRFKVLSRKVEWVKVA